MEFFASRALRPHSMRLQMICLLELIKLRSTSFNLHVTQQASTAPYKARIIVEAV